MGKLRHKVFHPFLLALNPIFILYLNNSNQLNLSDTLFSIILVMLLTFLMLLAAKFILKDIGKAGVLLSIFIYLFFSYREIYFAAKNWTIGPLNLGTDLNLFLAGGIILAVASAGVVRKKGNLPTATFFLNVFALILVLITLYDVAKIERAKYQKRQSWQADRDLSDYFKAAIAESVQPSKSARKPLPDIYYIILDTYARADTLQSIYNYDNSNFIARLKKKGFFVAEKSSSNYTFTQLSLASSLNMEYINYLNRAVGKKSRDPSLAYLMVANNKTAKLLKAKGYKFINFSTGWGPTKSNRLADINYSYLPYVFDEFNRVLIESTAAWPVTRPYIKAHARRRILYNFDRLAEVPKIKEPTFAFAHFVLPHQPYLFDRDGAPVSLGKFEMGGDVWKYKEAYLDQLIYTNKKIDKILDKILRDSETPPIIILQADHGPSSTRGWDNPSNRLLNERMNILNAYYFPDGGKNILYESITPVNSFRSVFNYYFDAGYPILTDRSYFSTKVEPHNFKDVTDRLSQSF